MDDTGFADIAELELRVLHGPQAGSSLPLEDGQTYTLGTADTCEVLLAGPQVEARHATVTADANGIRIEPLSGKVVTIDRLEVGEGDVVHLGTVLRLGRVKITVDHVESPWPQDDALETPEAPVPAPAPPASAQDEAAAEAPAVPEATPAIAARRKAASRSRMPQLLLGSTAILLVGAAVAAWLTAQSDASKARVAAAAPVASIAARPASDVRKPALDASQRMAAALDFVEKRRVAGEMELTVQPGTGGALRIGGAAATAQARDAMIEAAQRDLAAAGPLEFAVLLRPDLAAKFEERLRASGLAPKFKVTRREPGLELAALLTAGEVQQWESLFRDFTREFGSVLPITARVQHERDSMEAAIETVVGGPFPYVVTTTGRRVSPGGSIDGHVLVAVQNGELVFADGLRLRYAN